MKLGQISKKLFLENNNFINAGTIYIDEIDPTIRNVSSVTGIPNLQENLLGSTGKKQYSGDIDLSVDIEDRQKFITDLKKQIGESNVRSNGLVISGLFPIQNYDKTKVEKGPRTGVVQVDFMVGKPEFNNFYYHSPVEESSKLKGAHRNLLISAISVYADRKQSIEEDSFGRPVKTIRWKFGPKGLMRVERESLVDSKGNWVRKQKDNEMTEYLTSPSEIAAALFRRKFGPEVLESAETIIEAVKQTYPADVTEKIFEKAAYNFKDSKLVDFDFPEEILKYMGEK